ncbi:NADP-dependent oxidoreductase [Methyloferula stellata]|uniref:NADP-dependent oxidoreductase n=1 Tax=Methyloferula stellata TaxID=876270 RepID=UPI000362AEAC|nr:NADP-dependent oxidoreductase [Methyloferula stellata]
MFLNKGFVLASRPEGAPRPENFRLVTSEVAEPAGGEVIVRHHYLSLDPYMRGRMNAAKSYAEPQKLDAIMIGGTVGEVVASQNPAFAVGDMVVGMGGWQLYARSTGQGLRKITRPHIPVQAFLGLLGMPGITAWYGINAILAPKPGEVVTVSAATGAVGSVAGQLAKMAGARVIGIAGGEAKCRFAVEVLGYDLCIDHRAPDFEARLAAALPDGVDCVFENVGGKPLALCLERLRDFSRIAICGLVASGYDGATPTPLRDLKIILDRRARIEGFVITDHRALWPQAIDELADYFEDGRLGWTETVEEGLEAAPEAFIGMLQGKNFGKQLVKLI